MLFVIMLAAVLSLIATVASVIWFISTRKRKQLLLGGCFLLATVLLCALALMKVKGTGPFRGLLARQGNTIPAPENTSSRGT